MLFHIGDVWKPTFTTKNSDGTLADPTTVTITVTAPDTSTSTPTVTKDSTGNYHASIPLTQTGEWHAVIAGTGTLVGVQPVNINVYDLDD